MNICHNTFQSLTEYSIYFLLAKEMKEPLSESFKGMVNFVPNTCSEFEIQIITKL